MTINYIDSDSVTVQNAYRYAGGVCFIENIEFADGTKWNTEEIITHASIKQGTDSDEYLYGYSADTVYDNNETFYAGNGNDTVYANDGNDIIYGESGNDSIIAASGDDTLNGGIGNDYLEGGVGNDTYIFNIGDGIDRIYDYENSQTEGRADKIIFGEGISAEDIVFSRNGNDLTISYSESDSVTVQNAYRYAGGVCFIENIEFADGNKGTIDYNSLSLELEQSDESNQTISIDSVVDQCVSNIETFSLFEENTSGDEIDYNSSYAQNTTINNMVNLIVQDMSEFSTGTVSELDTLAKVDTSNTVVQLWIE